MRVLHFADLHIGMENYGRLDPKTGLHSRLADFLNAFDFLVTYAVTTPVDAVVFAGDAFKSRDPNPTHQREFSRRIRKLAKAGIPTVLIVGNHDTPLATGRATSLEIYPALEIEGVWVSRTPEILTLPTRSGTLQILSLPWLTRQEFGSLGDTLQYLYGKLSPDLPTVLVSHADVSGAIYGSERQVSIGNEQVIPLSLLTHPRVHYVALGHIHKHQMLASKPPVVYAGSIERIDFGEEKEEKGFIDVTIENGHVSWQFIPTPTRRLVTVTSDLSPDDPAPTESIISTIAAQNLGNAIVRLVLNIPGQLAGDIGIEALHRALQNSGAYYCAGIIRNVERVDRKSNTSYETIGQLTPLAALSGYCKAKHIDPRRAALLKTYAEKLV